jgi:hypothetical protein
VQCVLLNDDVDPIVRRAWSKLSMRWRYAEAQATVLLYDGFAVLDRERSDVDSKLGGNHSDWIEVSGDASATSRASACRSLHQRPLGQYGWCLRSVRLPASTTARSAIRDASVHLRPTKSETSNRTNCDTLKAC